MKKQIWAAIIAAAVIGFGCGGSKEKSNLSSDGLLGKLPSIIDTYKKADSALEAKAKNSAKSMDDLIKYQSDANKLKDDAKKEFAEEAAKIKLPLTIPFTDSTDGKGIKVQSVQITELSWDNIKVVVKGQTQAAAEKTMGGQVMANEVFGIFLDKAGSPVRQGSENWFIASNITEVKAGDVIELNGSIHNYVKFAPIAKIVFKTKDDWSKANGFH